MNHSFASRLLRLAVITLLPLLPAGANVAQEKAAVEAHVLRPRKVPATPERIRSLKVADGLAVSAFAEGLGEPRMIAVTREGEVYVTRREPGDLWLLKDADGDGRAEVKRQVLQRKDLHGIAIDGKTVYLATIHEVLTGTRGADGAITGVRAIVSDLPDAGQHPNRTLAVGPDGALYVSVGSTCNACREGPENATLLRMEKSGQGRRVFASGLRNTIGFAWHPTTRALWGLDHGIDYLGDDEQKEEVNRIEDGQKYGWPYAYADGKVYVPIEPPPGKTKEQWAAESKPPVLLLPAHSAPMQLAFATGSALPDRFRGGAFVTLHGSWNRRTPSGYEVVFLRFENGVPVAAEPFVSGFLTGQGEAYEAFGRPCGLATMPDGSLLVGDDAGGMIYRVAGAR